MPFLILLILFVSTSYQLFFRFEHWNDRNEPQLVYERDNLTGETHIIHPGDQISLVQRITGKFPPQNYFQNPGDASQQNTLASHSRHTAPESLTNTPHLDITGPVPLQELSLPPTHPPEPVNALATSETNVQGPVPKSIRPLTPPEPRVALVSVANNSTTSSMQNTPHSQAQHISYQQEKKLDLNQDGQSEKVTLHRATDGLLDIAILQGQQEVFYGRGESLQVLSHRNHGWADIALVIPNEPKQIFSYNPTKQTYEVAHSS